MNMEISEKVPDDVPGPMIPIYHNLRRAAITFANVIETSVPQGVDAGDEVDLVGQAFGGAVEKLKKWKG